MVDYFEGTNIPLTYVQDEDKRASLIADALEAKGKGQSRAWKSTLYDIGQASGDPHKISSGEYGLNQSIGSGPTGQGKTWAELSTSDPSGSGTTDVYKKFGGGTVEGPEYALGKSGDVDIHGYPDDWTTERVGDQLKITTADGHVYYKPAGGGSDTGDEDTTYGGGSGVGGGSVVISGMQPFDLATLTDEMDLIKVISNLINKDSPLFKAAGTAAMQRMAKRGGGMLNSSLALKSVEDSVIRVAADIGSKHVDNLIANLEKNTQWTNDQRKQANDYVFSLMVKEIDNAAALKLRTLQEESALMQQRYKGLSDIMSAGDDAELSLASYWDEYMKRVGLITATDTTDTA